MVPPPYAVGLAEVLEDPEAAPPEVSVIVPAHNEAHSLPPLARRLALALEGDQRSFELVIVDDGSTDESPRVLAELQARDPRIRTRLLGRRQGKSAALSCGIRAARGHLVVFMDADLQDVPEEVPSLLSALEGGPFDLVQAYRAHREDADAKVFASWVFNLLCWACSGLRLRDVNCGLKALRRDPFSDFQLEPGQHRFVPILAHQRGLLIGEVRVRHARRLYGKSRYGWGRYFAGLGGLFSQVLMPRLRGKPSPLPASHPEEAGAILARCQSRPSLSR